MGTLFSGVGLVSGLDISGIVDGLIAIDARPRDGLLKRIGNIDAQRTALMDISARISAMLTRLSTLQKTSTFRSSSVTSSDSDVLTVSTTESAQPGSYDFIVKQLATRHQMVSRGFTARDAALSPGTLTIESALARVNAATDLGTLNGFTGVQRGSFKLIDASGAKATINTSDAVTLNDVVESINAAGLTVQAGISGDGLVLTETTGGALQIQEVDDRHVAADLGFGPGNRSATGQLVGATLVSLGADTPLAALNDGNGLRHMRAGGDFSINGFTVDLGGLIQPNTRLEQLNHGRGVTAGTIRVTTYSENDFGIEHDIDLTGLETIDDVKNAIEDAVDGVAVTLADGRLVVSYADPSAAEDEQRRLAIQDVTGKGARDLGIAGDEKSGKINGRDVLSMDSLADVMAAINFAAGNDGSVTASINGARLEIDGGGAVSLIAMNNSNALFDLGFQEGDFRGLASGRRLVAGLDSSLLHTLNGGRGLDLGTIQIDLGAASTTVDLTAAESLQDVVDSIDAAAASAGLDITAGYDRTGRRLVLKSNDGVTAVSVSDLSGTFAKQAGLDQSGIELRGANLQKQYISETTRLDDLNGGSGVSLGEIKISNSLGLFATIDLSGAKTLGDVIEKINAEVQSDGSPFSVIARINDTGDGILLADSSAGTLKMKVTDESGAAASDLNIAGEFESGRADGSFELTVDVANGDTLDDLAARISSGTTLAGATLMNDGSAVSPYRLQITSSRTGLAGELLIDDSGLGLDFDALSDAQDAKVVFGTNPNSGLLITSSTNTISDVAPGVTLNLIGTSDDPVSVTIAEDLEAVISEIEGLVSSYNAAVDRIDAFTKYDSETEKRSVLLGDSAVRRIETRLSRLVTRSVPGATGQYTRLSQVGIRMESGSLTFDSEKFRAAYEDDPEGVIKFFTDPDSGVAAWMEGEVKAITDTDGIIESRDGVLNKQKNLLDDRVERMNELLNRKRARLTRQFLAMESALAEMQAQQSALSQLSSLVSGLSTSSSG